MKMTPDQVKDFERGSQLVFVMGAFRSGTTLLRKMLDTHSQVHSPAETWFLLPLVNLWDGLGDAPHFDPKQAAAAIRGHLNDKQFIACCRAFAARFYAANLPDDARYFVDKTPPYLAVAPVLPVLFPKARMLLVTRDPRGIAWSRRTWKHAERETVSSLANGVSNDIQALARFYASNRGRCLLVSYERLCKEPGAACSSMCDFLGLPCERGMAEYGSVEHHEGYGDELTLEHDRPHEMSIARWRGEQGFSRAEEREILDACGPEALETLGMGRLISELRQTA